MSVTQIDGYTPNLSLEWSETHEQEELVTWSQIDQVLHFMFRTLIQRETDSSSLYMLFEKLGLYIFLLMSLKEEK